MRSGAGLGNTPLRRCAWCAVVATTAVSALACGDALVPKVGAVQVTIATNGDDVDADGYLLVIDSEPIRETGSNGASLVGGLEFGRHEVVLTGVAENCIVTGGERREVTIQHTGSIPLTFQIQCERAGIEVTVSQSGGDEDVDGYVVTIDGEAASYVGSSQPVVVSRLPAGDHLVRLDGLAPNCSVEGANPVVVTTAARGLAPVRFSVTCTRFSGTLEIRVSTTGTDPDFDGYLLRVDDGAPYGMAFQGTAWLGRVPGGTRTIRMESIAPNCAAAGNPRVLNLAIGDTVLVDFQVTCVRAEKIAFSRGSGGAIVVVYEDGSNGVVVTGGEEPSWSPDGQRLIFATCEYSYYDYGCIYSGIAIADSDGRNRRHITTGRDENPAWSPDGALVAFGRSSGNRVDVNVVTSSGGTPAPLALPESVTGSADPTWSPDATRIAFTCTIDGSMDICVVNRDGSGFVRLTSDPALDFEPDWSPDGTRIAFATTRSGAPSRIAVMNADGSGVTQLAPGLSPDWSRNGTRIVFVGVVPNVGLYVMHADGTGVSRISSEVTANAPAWRP